MITHKEQSKQTILNYLKEHDSLHIKNAHFIACYKEVMEKGTKTQINTNLASLSILSRVLRGLYLAGILSRESISIEQPFRCTTRKIWLYSYKLIGENNA